MTRYQITAPGFTAEVVVEEHLVPRRYARELTAVVEADPIVAFLMGAPRCRVFRVCRQNRWKITPSPRKPARHA